MNQTGNPDTKRPNVPLRAGVALAAVFAVMLTASELPEWAWLAAVVLTLLAVVAVLRWMAHRDRG
jgi:hypothetical protein